MTYRRIKGRIDYLNWSCYCAKLQGGGLAENRKGGKIIKRERGKTQSALKKKETGGEGK